MGSAVKGLDKALAQMDLQKVCCVDTMKIFRAHVVFLLFKEKNAKVR